MAISKDCVFSRLFSHFWILSPNTGSRVMNYGMCFGKLLTKLCNRKHMPSSLAKRREKDGARQRHFFRSLATMYIFGVNNFPESSPKKATCRWAILESDLDEFGALETRDRRRIRQIRDRLIFTAFLAVTFDSIRLQIL